MGLLAHRRPGQTSWSRALVGTHGADPSVALTGVLGVPAGDIRVRDRPEEARGGS